MKLFHAVVLFSVYFRIKVKEPAFITCNNVVKGAYRSINYNFFLIVIGPQSESEEPSGHTLSGIPSFPPSPGHHVALFQSLLALPVQAPGL